MSPFSKLLVEIRQKRGLRQNQMANLLGLEQSYLSALECGHKPPPKNDKLNYLVNKLNLGEEQANSLRLAANWSARNINIPNTVSMQKLEMFDLLRDVLPKISDKQLQIIKLTLELSQTEET